MPKPSYFTKPKKCARDNIMVLFPYQRNPIDNGIVTYLVSQRKGVKIETIRHNPKQVAKPAQTSIFYETKKVGSRKCYVSRPRPKKSDRKRHCHVPCVSMESVKIVTIMQNPKQFGKRHHTFQFYKIMNMGSRKCHVFCP